MTSLIIRNFGGLRLSTHGRDVELAPEFPRALFAFLGSRPGRTLSRSRLAGLLWPDLEIARGRKALNTALWRLRQTRALRPHLVAPSKTTVRLDIGRRGWVDTVAFEVRIRCAFDAAETKPKLAARWLAHALRMYNRDAFSDLDDDWAIERRAELENLYCDALFLHARLSFDAGDFHQCIANCRDISRLEPFREDVSELHVSALERSGNVAEARHVYARFTTLLRSELGVIPSFKNATSTRLAADAGAAQTISELHCTVQQARRSLGTVEEGLARLSSRGAAAITRGGGTDPS